MTGDTQLWARVGALRSLFSQASRSEALAITASCLRDLIPADDAIWTTISATDGAARAFSGSDSCYDPHLSEGLSHYGLGHPAVQSYLHPGDDGRPRRVSDVASHATWLGSAAYANLFRDRAGRHQLSIVTHLDSRGGRGWVLSRAAHDFTDREVDIAGALRPLLALVAPARSDGPTDIADAVLTRRETQVVALLDRGLTANAIARRCGTSPRTVHKHLEHIYRKLGTSDRVGTIHRARELGII